MKYEFTIWYEDEHGEPRIFGVSGVELTRKQAMKFAYDLHELTGLYVYPDQD